MKKILSLLVVIMVAATVSVKAQESETKVKPITTTGDKVHNVIHPHNKRAHGVKYKHKNENGKKTRAVIKTNDAVPATKKVKTEKNK
jgi:hypothetical protein